MHIAQTKRLGAEEGMKKLHEWKKGRHADSGFSDNRRTVFLRNRQGSADRRESTGSCRGAAEEQEETQPEITPGEMQGPQPGAEEQENSEPQGDPDHHPEPPPEEEIQNGTGDGALSPPSEASSGSVFGGTPSAGAVTDEALSGLLSSLAFPANNGAGPHMYVIFQQTQREVSMNTECRPPV